MNDLDRLLDQLARMHEGDAWHGPSVMEALDGVDVRQAVARPIDGAHSIWQIALHIVAWRHEVEARVRGKAPSLPEEGDWPAVPSEDAAAWAATRAALHRSHESLTAAVRQLDPAALLQPVGPSRDLELGTGVTVLGMLDGLVHHDAYHAGQISLLKKAK